MDKGLQIIVVLCALFTISCSGTSGLVKKDSCLDGKDLKAQAVESRCVALGALPPEAELCTGTPVRKDRNLTSRLKDLGSDLANLLNGKKHPRIPELQFPIESGVLSSPFGYRRGIFHSGVDICAKKGEPIHSCADGTVTFCGTRKGYRSYGQTVLLDHGKDVFTHYAHMSAIHVRKGQSIKAGQVIGLVGSTGRSTSPHLHLEVKVANQLYNPMAHFAKSELRNVEVAKSFSDTPMGPVPSRRRLHSRD